VTTHRQSAGTSALVRAKERPDPAVEHCRQAEQALKGGWGGCVQRHRGGREGNMVRAALLEGRRQRGIWPWAITGSDALRHVTHRAAAAHGLRLPCSTTRICSKMRGLRRSQAEI